MDKSNRKKVLLVDDEVDFMEFARIRLEANGYNVVTASNGREALEKLKTEKPDAVFLDILMPEINGIDVLKTIRMDDEKLPVFIITASSNEARFGLANKLNATGFVLKTDDLQGIINQLNEALKIKDKHNK